MRNIFAPVVLGLSLFIIPSAFAQTSPVTATCKDGTEFSGTTRSGACRGHKGVATWETPAAGTTTQGAAPAAAPQPRSANIAPATPGMTPATPPPTRSANAAPSAPPATLPNRAAPSGPNATNTAAGRPGGSGQVWVNSATKIYHCPGDRYYGKTKAGEYMSQSAAEAAGDRPSNGKACSS